MEFIFFLLCGLYDTWSGAGVVAEQMIEEGWPVVEEIQTKSYQYSLWLDRHALP